MFELWHDVAGLGEVGWELGQGKCCTGGGLLDLTRCCANYDLGSETIEVGDWSAFGDVNAAGTRIHNSVTWRELWWNGWGLGGATAIRGV